jgi:flagellar hook protein FlgE
MADSPSHKFGQLIGDLLEDIMVPELQAFCDERGLYLDKKGTRGAARGGKKVTWVDKFGNNHDLDFVIEKNGTAHKRGRPLAFIEAAWRRYTKHSRNKAQEIQGAILPIAEKHVWDQPFLGTVLAGEFTDGSVTQMQSSGFKVMYFPYDTVVSAFATVGIHAAFGEKTPHGDFQRAIDQVLALSTTQRHTLRNSLIEKNSALLATFFSNLKDALDRKIQNIVLIPLHGGENHFTDSAQARSFINGYNTALVHDYAFRRFDIMVEYDNGSKVQLQFETKPEAVEFLEYIAGA